MLNTSMETYTITFGDQAENHAGMQKIGAAASEGFTLDDLLYAKESFAINGADSTLYELGRGAYVLVAHKGLDALIRDYTSDDFYEEQRSLPKDTQAYMRGRVVNKHARHNLCFSDHDQEPDYANKKGRIVSFDHVPLLKHVRDVLPIIIGDKGKGLVAEGNYYYDITKCGIGFHGDTERRKVVGIRVGASLPLHYQWYYDGERVGERIIIPLHHGDVYIMSDKAVGWDWKRRKTYTLRHATGADKYTR